MLLQVEELSIHFPTSNGVVRAVDGVNFQIDSGEVVGLVGESGCGKSTTALSLMGLIPSPGRVTNGKITLRGVDLLKLSEGDLRKIRGKEIAMVFQDPSTYLNPVMKIRKQISESIQLEGITANEAKHRAIDLLNLVKIPSPERVAEYYPHQLSGGMRQRVLIAIALSRKPSLIITDECTSALDVTVQRQILMLLKELRHKLGMSLLLITHDLGVVADICDRIYVMYAGKIFEEANVFDLFGNPKHPYTVGLLGSVPTTRKREQVLQTIPGSVPNLVRPPAGCSFHPRCVHAMPICSKVEPSATEFGGDHRAYCWLYTEGNK